VRIRNRHERLVAAPAERIAPLIADLDRVWPTELAPAPRPCGDRLYEVGPLLWEEVSRTELARAFRVIRLREVQAEHRFELEPADGRTIVRHTVEGRAEGAFEATWRDRIEPLHNRILETLLDNVETAAVAGD
jgi:hypothetical protein